MATKNGELWQFDPDAWQLTKRLAVDGVSRVALARETGRMAVLAGPDVIVFERVVGEKR